MNVFLGVTGASGAPYAARLLRALDGVGLRGRARGVGRGCRGARDRALRRREPPARRRARSLHGRHRGSHGLRRQRLQEPVRVRLGEGGRLRRLPVLDVDRGNARGRRDGEPDPPRRLGRAEGRPQARARPARDAALVHPSERARDACSRQGRRSCSRRPASTTAPRRSTTSSTSSSRGSSTSSGWTTRSSPAGASRDPSSPARSRPRASVRCSTGSLRSTT